MRLAARSTESLVEQKRVEISRSPAIEDHLWLTHTRVKVVATICFAAAETAFLITYFADRQSPNLIVGLVNGAAWAFCLLMIERESAKERVARVILDEAVARDQWGRRYRWDEFEAVSVKKVRGTTRLSELRLKRYNSPAYVPILFDPHVTEESDLVSFATRQIEKSKPR